MEIQKWVAGARHMKAWVWDGAWTRSFIYLVFMDIMFFTVFYISQLQDKWISSSNMLHYVDFDATYIQDDNKFSQIVWWCHIVSFQFVSLWLIFVLNLHIFSLYNMAIVLKTPSTRVPHKLKLNYVIRQEN